MSKQANKGVYVAALVLFLAGLGYLVFSGLSENSVYFLNVSEAMAMDRGQLKQARLFGTVDAEGLEQRAGSLGVKFRLLDKDDKAKAVWVEYRGSVPDTFKPEAEVIVEGGFKADPAVFDAATLMTKCPSKYEKENRRS